ncbi:hypothetical protein BDR07DRAFT_1428663 [Suillus spraguei]|nr:hypothetical protein BDR07DRAFT_1428663 [Suillus spraguei]
MHRGPHTHAEVRDHGPEALAHSHPALAFGFIRVAGITLLRRRRALRQLVLSLVVALNASSTRIDPFDRLFPLWMIDFGLRRLSNGVQETSQRIGKSDLEPKTMRICEGLG